MKTMKNVIPFIFCVLYFFNPVHAQNLIKEGVNGNPFANSIVYESNDNASKIGIGTTIPNAKLHVVPTSSIQSVCKIDGKIFYGGMNSDIGSIESWKNESGVYYGIFQTQSDLNPVPPKNYFKNNVGIDVLDPAHKLDVNGIIGCTGTSATGIMISNTNQPFVFQYYSTSGSGGLPEDNPVTTPPPAEEDTATLSPLTLYKYGAKVQNYFECTGTVTTQGLRIKNNAHSGSVLMSSSQSGLGSWTDPTDFSIIDGHVRIGFDDNLYPTYLLAVNGKAICTEMKVKLKSSWPDFVFDKDYQLRSLDQVDQFVRVNGHLPEIPSAKEVSENGINLGEMNALLLKKVEELTLYVIELKKEMNQLKTNMASQ